ncbi:hypothetical protein NL676_003740 [Syzygium grande]|nr:hypothetical protein NL676_003740 [Syzygium grande]
MKLLLSFNGEVSLSSPSFVPAFTQGPSNVTMVQAEALSTLAIVNDWGVKGRVSTLNGGMVTIDVVAEAKRRLHLGPWRVAVFDVYFSCMDVTFTAPTNSKGGSDLMILGGTMSCIPDIFTILCHHHLVAVVMTSRDWGASLCTGEERCRPALVCRMVAAMPFLTLHRTLASSGAAKFDSNKV